MSQMTLDAVSYTHLDVYKRQVTPKTERTAFGGFFPEYWRFFLPTNIAHWHIFSLVYECKGFGI